jgi:UDP-N-acetylglucosamine acyltransferase
MTVIHPAAVISPGAVLGADVEVGPYSFVGPNVVIGAGTKIGPHVIIDGWVTMGEGNTVLSHAVVGSPPQDLAWKGDRSYLKIGDRNVIHEFVTISPGTKPESETVIGNDCMFMIGVHVAHNDRIGNNVIIVNYTALGGYVEVGDRAFLSAFVAVHQFVKIGRMAMVASFSKIAQDFPPFMMGQDAPTTIYGLNSVGLQRAGLSSDTRLMIKRAYKHLYHGELNFSDAVKAIESDPQLSSCPEVMELAGFVKNATRGVCRHHA